MEQREGKSVGSEADLGLNPDCYLRLQDRGKLLALSELRFPLYVIISLSEHRFMMTTRLPQ